MKRILFNVLIFLFPIFSFSVFSADIPGNSKNTIDPSSRSADIVIYNFTDKTLSLSSMELLHGQWAHQPPYNVFSHKSASFRSESHGFLTGTEGEVMYRLRDNSAIFTIHWDIPYWGYNSYDINSSSPLYKISREGEGGGNNVHLKIIIKNAKN